MKLDIIVPVNVYVAGVFDLFHVGHLRLLERAKELTKEGGALIVGVLTDDAAAAYKPRPIIPYEQRWAIVRALKCVDFVLPQFDTDATVSLARYAPDILVHGDDHTPGWEIGQTWMEKTGREFVILPRTDGVSSTEIKRRIIEREQSRLLSHVVFEAGDNILRGDMLSIDPSTYKIIPAHI